ncbi:alpha/beta hydrolase fold domain-containing protein [Streptomyces sp. SID625]|nr:alpha/beta hydrolase fold domain-containing protein [Streptomyces sp. SID625]
MFPSPSSRVAPARAGSRGEPSRPGRVRPARLRRRRDRVPPSAAAPFPARIEDARTAIRHLCRNASEFRTAPDRVVMWGASSGGHTTVLTCLTETDQYFSDEPLWDEPLNIRCFVDTTGPPASPG